jgi:hypothetical protein|tara:strand:+ start:66701 stop:67030 length:330 start_codon:yes stop_codon:yes gene_type:complete
MAFETRLKTDILVAAEIRRCANMSVTATINHKGDQDRGLLLIKQYVYNKGCKVYTQSRDMDDNLSWHTPFGEEWVEEAKVDQYIARQIGFDEDLWVLEVEDSKNVYAPL